MWKGTFYTYFFSLTNFSYYPRVFKHNFHIRYFLCPHFGILKLIFSKSRNSGHSYFFCMQNCFKENIFGIPKLRHSDFFCWLKNCFKEIVFRSKKVIFSKFRNFGFEENICFISYLHTFFKFFLTNLNNVFYVFGWIATYIGVDKNIWFHITAFLHSFKLNSPNFYIIVCNKKKAYKEQYNSVCWYEYHYSNCIDGIQLMIFSHNIRVYSFTDNDNLITKVVDRKKIYELQINMWARGGDIANSRDRKLW